MPKQLRWAIKQDLDLVIKHMLKSLYLLEKNKKLYKEGGKEKYVQMFENLQKMITEVADMVEEFKNII